MSVINQQEENNKQKHEKHTWGDPALSVAKYRASGVKETATTPPSGLGSNKVCMGTLYIEKKWNFVAKF